MPNPMPPANRPHGSGDRNEHEVAEVDKAKQDRRDAKEAPDAREANRAAHADEGIEHP